MISSATTMSDATAPEAEGRGDLVVAAAPGVQLRPDVADQLGHTALDGGVDVLVPRGEDERPGLELLLDDVERLHQRASPRCR